MSEVSTHCVVIVSGARTPMGAFQGSLKNVRAPELILLLDIGEDQIILGREVVVEGRLGDIGFRDDAVDAHRADALGIKQPRRGIQ